MDDGGFMVDSILAFRSACVTLSACPILEIFAHFNLLLGFETGSGIIRLLGNP